MILDRLERLGNYRGISRELDTAINWLTGRDLAALPDGRHTIDGDSVYVTLMRADFKENLTWEKHRHYIDIQIALEAGESIAWAPAESLAGWSPYDAAKGDIQLSQDPVPGLLCQMAPGSFGIYFPNDAHRPGIGQGQGRKAVVKVAVG